ncbi:hypothetical protein [Subtercola boreus]|uniref:Uncharacterized protein n=1 Tax=Subtercola boreus TaxID=120213 RepID=A0A3E0W8N8_9MICO|nr:hypothetical protein [Subtercola boreus]RFA19310.1 hypothetical protein B7R24_11700 [Subtercola boreus]RFA19571.1 hypothetical protein B7R23_11680 [Subtercola boreus]RFA25936.1 hypothetical protein B7R25_11800 [Subtercola boreus]
MFRVSQRSDDLSLLQFSTRDPIDWVDADQFGRGIAAGSFRREWTWLAFVDDAPDATPVARAVWWGPTGSVHPVELRSLIVDESLPHPELWGAALIRSAHAVFRANGALFAPVVVIGVDSDWQQDVTAVAAVAWRIQAASDAGATTVVRSPEREASTVRPAVGTR